VLPRFRRGAFALFALSFCVTMFLGDRAALAVVPHALLDGRELWTLLIAGLREPEGVGMLGLLWTLLAQWLLGSRLEGFWGTARYLIMAAVASLVGYASLLALALALPESSRLAFAGAGPIDTAAAVAFAWVFAGERMQLFGKPVSPTVIAALVAVICMGFPMLVGVVHGSSIGVAWSLMLPSLVAAVVATLFVQPWRRREKSGKVGREARRDQPHLRIVRSADDLLN
jgi:hypothetical protein